MGRRKSEPGDDWYLALEKHEAKQVSVLETAIEHLDKARSPLLKELGIIRMRATKRLIASARGRVTLVVSNDG